MQIEQFTTQALPTIRSGKPSHKPQRVFMLVATLLTAVLLVGGTISAFSVMQQRRNASVEGKSIPTATAQATKPSSMLPFPAQDCPVVSGADLSSTWYQLCKAGKFVEINQSRTLSKGYTLTIQAAYADRSNLFLLSDVSPIDISHQALISFIVKTQQGTDLPRVDATAFRAKDQGFISVWHYDTSHLPASMQTLTLQVHASVDITTVTSPVPLSPVDFANVSVPLTR